MTTIRYSIAPAAYDGLSGLPLLAAELPVERGGARVPLELSATRESNGYDIRRGADHATIIYRRPCDAYRALATLVGGGCPVGGEVTSNPPFDLVGLMIDASRNGVPTLTALKRLLRQFALLGINSIQLYIEEVYALPQEPFFGYGRGPYGPEELREIDRFGATLGIEVIPCIQTLGHLEQALQWPAYESLIDVQGVLLAEEEKTYALISKMIAHVASCFQSRRIHIGMDEAHGVGTGRYKQIHGERRRFDILTDHLRKVVEICSQHGLSPMMWSDMFFRIGSTRNDYYDKDAVIPPGVGEAIPPEVDLVYWDYYHPETSVYDRMLTRHREMGKEPLLATGAWTWGRFWPGMDMVIATHDAGMAVARKEAMREVFITIWGDDGAECHPQAFTAPVAYFAQLAYHENADADALEGLFRVATGGSFAAYCKASELDVIPRFKEAFHLHSNLSKWLLWHDPVLNFFALEIPPELPSVYRALADRLDSLSAEDGSGALAFPALLARVLWGKARLHLELRECYAARDAAGLKALREELLTPTRAGLERLWEMHRQVWSEWFKPFGWEVIDSRYATVASRLKELDRLLANLIAVPQLRIEEFEHPLARLNPEDDNPCHIFNHRRVVTPSFIR